MTTQLITSTEIVIAYRKNIFMTICNKFESLITPEFINSIKTCTGNTQTSERQIIQKVREVIESLNLSYKEAGSQ